MMLRSLLFTPATSDRKIMKAFESAADAVIIDLEDAVALGQKTQARTNAAAVLKKGPRSRPAYVRINGLGTPFAFADLMEIGAALPDGIILPKVESDSDIKLADWFLAQIEIQNGAAPGRIDLVPLIETSKGIEAAGRIATAGSRVRRMAFGAVDLALDMDIDLEDEYGALAQARFAVCQASRLGNLEGPIDTAFIDIQALDRLRLSTLNARRMGYSAKCCIHPAQIDVVNAVFTPSIAEVEKAKRIVAAFGEAERSGAAAVSLDGLMIDYPVVDRARRLLSRVGAASDGFDAACRAA